MGRSYSLVISTPAGQIFQPTPTGAFALASSGSTFSSQNADGTTNPGALNIELDLPTYAYHTPQGGSIIRLWGVGLAMIGQAANLNGMNFKLSAGMQKGLPLANPAQYGLIAQGSIYQAFGNWEGVDQTLDLIVNPTFDLEAGIAFVWLPGTSLSSAVQSTLSQAFPTYNTTVNISADLQAPNSAPEAGVYTSLAAFAKRLSELTIAAGQSAIGPDYQGVYITIDNQTIDVYDGEGDTAPKNWPLAFQDLIGQPTWIGAAQITFKCVMRADIQLGNTITFPQGVITPYALTSADAAAPNAPSRSKTVFQGQFSIQEVHHYGNFRQPDAQSWNTTYVAAPLSS